MIDRAATHAPLMRWPCEGMPFDRTYSGLAQRYRRSWLRRLQPLLIVVPLGVFSVLLPDPVGRVGTVLAIVTALLLVALDYIVWEFSTRDLIAATRDQSDHRRTGWRHLENRWHAARAALATRGSGDRGSAVDMVAEIPEFVWPLGICENVPPIPLMATFTWSQEQLAETESRIQSAVVEKLAASGFDGVVLRTTIEGTGALAIGTMAGEDCQVWLLARTHQTATGLAFSVRCGLAFWVREGVLRSGRYYRGDQFYLMRALRRTYLYALSKEAIAGLVIWIFMVAMFVPPTAHNDYVGISPTPMPYFMFAMYAIIVLVARGVHDWPCLYSRGARDAERAKYQSRYPEVPGEFGDLGLLSSARPVTQGARSSWAGPEPETVAKAEAIKQHLLQLFRMSVAQQGS